MLYKGNINNQEVKKKWQKKQKDIETYLSKAPNENQNFIRFLF